MGMTDIENSKCRAIIHSAAVAAGAVGAGLAQLPLADNVVIMPIQIGMVASLGNVFGKNLGEAAIKGLISAAAATVVGRSASQALLGWIPVLGNAINASTAFALTESIGLAIANNFATEAENERKKIAEKPQTSKVMKFFLGIVTFFRLLPGRVCRTVAYVAGGIWGAIRTFAFMIRGLFTGNALLVLRWLCNKIWSGICALVGIVVNAAVIGVVITALLWAVGKTGILSPEYLAFLRDILQTIKQII